MLEPASARAARRAARRRQLRRQRFAAAFFALLVLGLATYAVVALASGGSSPHRVVVARAPAAPSNTVLQPPHAAPGGELARIDALGNANIRRLARLGLPVYCGGARGRELAFTFDDGPGPYTHYAVRKLAQSGERATFFVVGRSMDYFPGWLPKEVRVAAIGDHTYTHRMLTELSPDEVYSEIERTRQKIEAASGQPVDLFRPPYGALDASVEGIVKRLGLLTIMWSVDSGDSLGADWTGIIRNVEAGMHPGAIIEMHENRGQTIRALTTLLPVLRRRHLHSVSLPELLATDPPSAAQVRRGHAGCGRTVTASLSGE